MPRPAKPSTRPRASSTVAAYVRVSSTAQGHAMQEHAIAQAAKARGDKIGRWFVETMSGKSTRRPALAEVRAAVRAGEVRRLYVYRVDRLTRSGIRDTLELVEEFTRGGCQLVTIADGLDFGGNAGEVLLAVVAWAAKVERVAIAERISAARRRVEAEGGSWGRPLRLTRGEHERVRDMASEGKSVRAIAVAMKVPRSTVYRALSRKPASVRIRARARKQEAAVH